MTFAEFQAHAEETATHQVRNQNIPRFWSWLAENWPEER